MTQMCFILIKTQKCWLISSTTNLKKLEVRLSVNKLSLNVIKTNYMLFSKCKKTENMEIYMNNSGISRVKVTKFLGVIINENLNWKEHSKLVTSKISKNIAILYKAM